MSSQPPTTLKWIPLPAPLNLKHSQTNQIIITVDTENAFPCRRCLTDAHINEQMLLVSYDPFFSTNSPYRSPSAIFVHKHECTPYTGSEVPEQQRRRLLSVRAYDEADMMIAAEVVDGPELAGVARKMLGDAGVKYLHVHNAKQGCFAVRVEKGEEGLCEAEGK